MNTSLSAWQNFYVIIGSAGAALIGIQFVVIAFVSNLNKNPTAESISAFATPTVLHLGGALLVSAIMCAPWPSLFPASVALTVCGLAGLGYGATVIFRTRRQTIYKPVLEDWLWHVILPCGIHAAIALAGVFLRAVTQRGLFVIGAAALGLLLIGIHNAWDTVTYMVISRARDSSAKVDRAK
jgi:hypothetical protein